VTAVIAHRGASATWPEHTRAAYVQAIDDGADGLECDVHLTADGVAVCWHDATVDRTSDGTGPVHAHTLAQLRALDLLGGARPPARCGAPGE
jgi:glycerophosphoryl diester phosphodiesterase